MQLLDYILGLILTMIVMAIVHVAQIQAFQDQARDLLTKEAATEQVEFSRAVGQYLNTANLTEGATISVPTLKTVGLLPGGYPATNPFGQTPMAYVGNNNVAIATYTGLPSSTVMNAIGYNTSSTLSMGGLMEKMVLQASSDQETLAYMLIAVQVQGGVASSPFTGRSVTLTNYFSGVPAPTTPIFGDLVNMDSDYSGIESQ